VWAKSLPQWGCVLDLSSEYWNCFLKSHAIAPQSRNVHIYHSSTFGLAGFTEVNLTDTSYTARIGGERFTACATSHSARSSCSLVLVRVQRQLPVTTCVQNSVLQVLWSPNDVKRQRPICIPNTIANQLWFPPGGFPNTKKHPAKYSCLFRDSL